MSKPKYDTTVARIAGNIASGMASRSLPVGKDMVYQYAEESVALARAIVAKVKRTETPEGEQA